jgi:hypothetical protein
MSLIQEALRRKDDGEGGGGPPLAPPRISPLTQAVAPPLPPPQRSSRAWVVLAVSLVVLIGLAAVAAVLLLQNLKTLPLRQAENIAVAEPATQPASQPMAVAPSPPAPKLAPTPAPVAEKPAPSRPVATEVAVAPATETTVVEAASVPAHPIAPPAPPGEEAVQSSNVEVVVLPPAGERAPAAGLSSWPRLKLVGVMAKSNVRSGSAIVDNAIVEVGEDVKGVKLLEVHQSGALLQYEGQTQFVRVGQVTQ